MVAIIVDRTTSKVEENFMMKVVYEILVSCWVDKRCDFLNKVDAVA
jgi:hypothetical protein